jgi:peptide/nickel transport system ATP-binding protein
MTLVDVRDLSFSYGRGAPGSPGELDDLTFAIAAGAALGIVGESGSGKSTLIRLLCGLQRLQGGEVFFAGTRLQDWLSQRPRAFRSKNQFVFQDPANSFDPRMRVGMSLAEPSKALTGRKPSSDALIQWLDEVGLAPDLLPRYPHQLSGGQLQRVALARALSVSPEILYADECTSGLDVSVQAQVLNLLGDLRKTRQLTLVLVSHDLAVVSRVCDTVIVLNEGRLEEAGPTWKVLSDPQAPYTRRLVAAAKAVSVSVSPNRRAVVSCQAQSAPAPEPRTPERGTS